MSILFDMLKQENFLIVNKLLIQSIGLDEAILFAELVSKHDYYMNQNKLNADGSFYCTISDIEMSTGLKEKVQAKAIKNLKSLGLIQVIVRGLPARRFFYITNDENLLKKYLEAGKQKLDKYYNKDNNSKSNNNAPSNLVKSTDSTFGETTFTTENGNNNTHTVSPSVSVSPKSETSIDKNQNLSGEKSKQDFLNVEEIISNSNNIKNNNPINYSDIDGNVDITNMIDLNFGTWEKLHNQELLKQSQIYGEAYELMYTDSDGNFKCTVLNPLNCYVLEDETVEKNVILAIHFYQKKFDNNQYADIYVDNRILVCKLSSASSIEILEEKTHNFDRVPLTVCYGNNERKSAIEDIKTLNDSYNSVLSDCVNESSDMRSCFIKIIGAEVETEDLTKMKGNGIIQVPEGADVSFMLKDVNSQFAKDLLDTTEDKIYQLACHINHNERMQSNLSGLSLRSRLISLENKCSLMQAQIERVIKLRLKTFFSYMAIKTNKSYDYRKIKVKFTPNIPADLATTAQIITQLNGIISHRTALSLLPFIDNPDLELERWQKEQTTIPLDNVPFQNNVGANNGK